MKQKAEFLPDWNIIKPNDLSISEMALLYVLKYHIGTHQFSTVGQKCLASELNISRATVIKLVSSLERKGWITVTSREYATHEYRLNLDKIRLVNAPKVTPPVSSDDTPLHKDLTGGCIPIVHKVNTTKKDKPKIKSQVFAGLPATTSEPLEIKEPVGEDIDINTYPIETSKPANVPELQKIWKARIAENYPDQQFVADLTKKERGQLQDFIKALGNNDPIKVFDAVISNWFEFKVFVAQQHGDLPLNNMSNMPSMGFILLHVTEAGNFIPYLEKKSAREKADLEAIAERHKQFEFDKAAKEAAALKAQANMTDEERFWVQYDIIERNEFWSLQTEWQAAGRDIGGDEFDQILEDRTKTLFATLLSEGSVQLRGGVIVSLDSKEIKTVSNSK